MKGFLASSLFATVQLLVITLIASPAFAEKCPTRNGITYEETSDGKCRIVDCGSDREMVESESNGVSTVRCVPKKKDKDTRCDDLAKDIAKAQEEQSKACSEAGIDVGDCIQQVQRCIDNANNEDDHSALGQVGMDALKQMFPAMGQTPLNLSALTSNGGEKCPNEGSKDYFEEKDRLQRDLKEIDRENADIEKDIAEEKSKLDKDIKESKDDLARVQKEANEKKSKLETEKREAATQHAKAAQETADRLRKLQADELTKRAEVQKYESDHNRKLLRLNDKMAQTACLAQVKKERDELIKAGLYSSNSSSTFMANATQKREYLQQSFDSCVADFKAQRIAMLDEYRNRIRSFNQELQNIQQSTQDAQDETKASQKQMEDTIAQLTQSQNQEDQALLTAMQNAQTNLQNSQGTTQARQQALVKKQASIQQRKLELQKELTNLGPQPKRGSKTGWRDAQRAVMNTAKRIVEFGECCAKGEQAKDNKDDPNSKYGKNHPYCQEKTVKSAEGMSKTKASGRAGKRQR